MVAPGRPARALAATWFAASAVAVVATSRTVGPLYAYRLHWAWALGMVGGVLVGWAGWTLATGRTGARARQVSIAVALAGARRADGGDDQRGDGRGAARGGGRPAGGRAGAQNGGGPRRGARRRSGARADGLVRGDRDGPRAGGRASIAAGVDLVIDDVGAGEHRTHRDGDPLRATLYVGVDSDVGPGDPRARAR